MSTPRHIRLTLDGDLLTMGLVGEVSGLGEDRELASVLEDISATKARHAVVDFGHIEFFGSALLEILLALGRRMETNGGRMALYHVSEPARQILHLARFDTLWPVVPDRPAALARLEPAQRV